MHNFKPGDWAIYHGGQIGKLMPGTVMCDTFLPIGTPLEVPGPVPSALLHLSEDSWCIRSRNGEHFIVPVRKLAQIPQGLKV